MRRHTRRPNPIRDCADQSKICMFHEKALVTILAVLLVAVRTIGGEIILETRLTGEPGSIDESVTPRTMPIPGGEQFNWFKTIFQPDGKLLALEYEYQEQDASIRGHLFRVNADGT